MDNEQETNNTPTPYYNIGDDSTLQYHKINVSEAVKALHYYQGNVTKASQQVGCCRSTLSRLIASSPDITKLVETLRHNKQQGLYEQATDTLAQLMNSEDESIAAKVALKLYDKGTPDTKPQEQEDNKEEQTVKAVAEYLQSLRSTSGPNYPNSDCKDH